MKAEFIVGKELFEKSQTEKNMVSVNNNMGSVKRKIFVLMILSLIIMLIGVSFLTIKVLPIIFSKKTQELDDDWDNSTRSFKSLNAGDRISIFGRLIEVIETEKFEDDKINRTEEFLTKKYGGKYIYVIDDDFKVYSNERLGINDEFVILNCEVTEIEEQESVKHILKVKSYDFFMPLIYLGIVILIIGIIAFYITIGKRKKYIKESSELFKLSKIYDGSRLEKSDGEEEMYKFLQQKAKNKLTAHKRLPVKKPLTGGTDKSIRPLMDSKNTLIEQIRSGSSKTFSDSTISAQKQSINFQKHEEDYMLIKRIDHSLKSEGENELPANRKRMDRK
jgi:hypothetical protein